MVLESVKGLPGPRPGLVQREPRDKINVPITNDRAHLFYFLEYYVAEIVMSAGIRLRPEATQQRIKYTGHTVSLPPGTAKAVGVVQRKQSQEKNRLIVPELPHVTVGALAHDIRRLRVRSFPVRLAPSLALAPSMSRRPLLVLGMQRGHIIRRSAPRQSAKHFLIAIISTLAGSTTLQRDHLG